MAEWYYVENGAQAGPISAEELQHKVTAGLVTPDTLVWKESLPEWTAFSNVPELQSTPTAPPPAAASATATLPSASTTPGAPPPGEAPVNSNVPGKIDLGDTLSQGWQIFTNNPWQSIILALVFACAYFVLVIVAAVLNAVTFILGSVLMFFAGGYLLVGLWKAAIALADRQDPPIGILFPDRKYILMPAVANLLFGILSGIGAAIIVVPFIVVGAMGSAGFEGNENAQAGAIFGAMLLASPLLMIYMLVTMLFMLWPALVADRDDPPVSALFTSFQYTWHSALPFIGLMLVLWIINAIGTLFFGIGLIATGAFSLCVAGVMYRQIVPATHRPAS